MPFRERESCCGGLGVPLRRIKELGVRYLAESIIHRAEASKGGEVVTREMEPDMFTNVRESFLQGSVLFFESVAWELQRGFGAEQLGSERVIGPANKELREVLLPLEALAVIVDVKEENAFAVEVDESGVELSYVAKKPYKVQNGARKYLFQAYNVPFQGLLETVEQYDKYISQGVQCVVCDPPRTSRWIVRLRSTAYNWLILHNMSYFGEKVS